MRKALVLASMLAASTAFADDDADGLGMAGLLSGSNKVDLPEVILSVGEPLADAPWKLKSGKYYEVEFTADGSGEIGLAGNDFFRAIWVDEVVIEGLEIRPYALHSVEFDDAGTMEIGFVAIRPGRYEPRIPGSTGESQAIKIEIE